MKSRSTATKHPLPINPLNNLPQPPLQSIPLKPQCRRNHPILNGPRLQRAPHRARHRIVRENERAIFADYHRLLEQGVRHDAHLGNSRQGRALT